MVEQTAESAGIQAGLRGPARDSSNTLGRERLRGIPIAVWLGLGVAGLTALRVAVAWRTPAPWIVADEPFYAQLARSFGSTGHFAIDGQPWSAWSFGPLYPILIAPIYLLFGPLTEAYFVVKVVNCLMMATAAIPAYLLARRLLEPRRAALAAFLSVLVPSGIYTTKVMTESLAYPLFLTAVLAMVLVLEQPSRRRELFLLGAIGLTMLTRAQLVVLLPAFACTALLVMGLDRRDEGLRGLALIGSRPFKALPITAAALGVACCVGILAFAGLPLGLGNGHAAVRASVSPVRVAESFVLHLASLDLYVGLLPFAGLSVMTGLAFKRGGSRDLRVLCVLTISLSCWLALVGAKYLVADYPGSFLRIYDRYVFYVVPLFLIAFVCWVGQGLPRPRLAAVIAAAGAAALPLVIPYSHVLSGGEWGVSSSSVALLPWANLRFIVGTPWVVYPVLLFGGTYLAWVFLRSHNREWLLFLVAANFVILNAFALSGNAAVAQQALKQGVGSTTGRSWIDAAVGREAHVDALWPGIERAGAPARYAIWESEFFNRSIRGFYYLREPIRRGYPGNFLVLRNRTLYLNGRPFRAEYVVVDAKTHLDGQRIAVSSAGMVLYRIEGQVRLRSG